MFIGQYDQNDRTSVVSNKFLLGSLYQGKLNWDSLTRPVS